MRAFQYRWANWPQIRPFELQWTLLKSSEISSVAISYFEHQWTIVRPNVSVSAYKNALEANKLTFSQNAIVHLELSNRFSATLSSFEPKWAPLSPIVYFWPSVLEPVISFVPQITLFCLDEVKMTTVPSVLSRALLNLIETPITSMTSDEIFWYTMIPFEAQCEFFSPFFAVFWSAMSPYQT